MNEKTTLILVSIKKDLKGSGVESLGAEFYSFIKILITKHDGSKANNAISDILRRVYGSYVMRHEMLNTQVIKKARSEMQSVYEVSEYSGAKSTLNRAIQIVDSINLEIEDLAMESWELTQSSILKDKGKLTHEA